MSKRVYVDFRVLSHDFIPPKLLCRDKQYEELSTDLKLVEVGFPPPNFVVLGPSGSGKTVTVRKVLSDLGFPHVYVVSEPLAYGTLCSMSSILTGRRRWGLSMGVLWSEVDKLMPKPCVIVLDEAEKFMVGDDRSDDLLYYLVDRPETGLILISNRMDLYDHVKDPRVRSRFNPRFLLFPPYKPEEIYAIVEDRLKLALGTEEIDELVDEGALKLLSALAAQKGGDARYAIDLLRESIRLWASREGLTGGRLSEVHVNEARVRVERSYVEDGVRSLSRSHKLMLLAALTSRTVGEAYRKFNELAERYGLPPLSERRLREVLSELEREGFVYEERIGNRFYVKRSKWLPDNVVDILEEELSSITP